MSGETYSPKEYVLPTFSIGPRGSQAVYKTKLSCITVTERGWSAELYAFRHKGRRTLIFKVEVGKWRETKIYRNDRWVRTTLDTLPSLKAKAYLAWLEVVTEEATAVKEDIHCGKCYRRFEAIQEA